MVRRRLTACFRVMFRTKVVISCAPKAIRGDVDGDPSAGERPSKRGGDDRRTSKGSPGAQLPSRHGVSLRGACRPGAIPARAVPRYPEVLGYGLTSGDDAARSSNTILTPNPGGSRS